MESLFPLYVFVFQVIKLWDLETGTAIFEYGDAHGDSAITCMTFDNTGRRWVRNQLEYDSLK